MLHGPHVMPDTRCSVSCYGKGAAALLQSASAIPGDTQLLSLELKAGVNLEVWEICLLNHFYCKNQCR